MQLPSSLAGYIFDLDGTLLDSIGVWNEIDEIFMKRHNLTITPEYAQAVAHMGFANTAQYTIDYFGMSQTPEQLMAEWHELSFEAYRDRVQTKPYVSEYLHQLHAQGIPFAAATSSELTLIEPCLKRLGLFSLFDQIVTINEAGHDKSKPDVYVLAAQRIGVCPKACVVFEDILKGIQSAKSADFYTVAVHEPLHSSQWEEMQKTANQFIYSFSELMD